MRVKITQDIEGKKAGETVDIPEDRAKFYLAEGYATTAADQDGVHATSVDAKLDPRLAENRKDAANATLGEQHADGLAVHSGDDPDDFERPPYQAPNPVERTNGNGDQEKGLAGKASIEKGAVETDPEDAPETNPEAVADAAKANDKAEAKVEKVEDAKADTATTEEAAAAAKKTASRRRS